jgi:hypothetical protein
MKSMMKTILVRAGNVLFLSAIAWMFLAPPRTSLADIYRWEDEGGVVHFTDDLGNIPQKYRNRQKPILKGPPPSGRPSVSTVESPPRPPAGGPSFTGTNETRESPAPTGDGNLSGKAEQLRAKIAAKEQFLEGVDRKRSNIANPLGNRFVSPEDLELYGKYKEELPQDRERLREIETLLPGAR